MPEQLIDVKPGRYREASSGRDLVVASVGHAQTDPPVPLVVNYAYLDDPGHVISTAYAEFASFGRYAAVIGLADAAPEIKPTDQ